MGSAQTNDIVQFGGAKNIAQPSIVLPVSALGSMMQFSAFVISSTTNNFLMFSKWSSAGSGQYQVTSGKSLRIFSVYINQSAAASMTFGYGTAALGSDDTATPPTGAKYFSSASTTIGFIGDASGWVFFPFFMEFPSLSFPFLKVQSSATTYNVILQGVEQ